MAFVRWRGNSATLLASVYQNGKSRQVLLAALGTGYRVPTDVRKSVTEQFPTIFVDWAAINRAMATGPPQSMPLSTIQISYLEVENCLREWANQACPYAEEAKILIAAANVLTARRSRSGIHDTE